MPAEKHTFAMFSTKPFFAWVLFPALVCALSSKAVHRASSACTNAVALDASKNIWLNYTLHPHDIYRDQYIAAAESINDTGLKEGALRVADSGTFLWIETEEDIPKIDRAVKNVPCGNILGLVINGLSHAGCDETTGRTPWQKRDSARYIESFITSIAERIRQYNTTAFALIIEPDVLPFVVRNPYYQECAQAQSVYRSSVSKAIKALDIPNAMTYLDAKHGGWFGWSASRTIYDPKDIARELTNTWQAAGGSSLTQFRGVSVNVRSYNSWDMSPGETFTDENAICAELFNKARNEQRYITILGQSFKAINSTFPLHAIFDSSRTAIQGIRMYWHDWCNNVWAGFGPRPTMQMAQQIHSRDKNFDAFVWATPVGFSDGSSDATSAGSRANCSSEIAFKPMPARNVFSQGYFESLLKNRRGTMLGAKSNVPLEDGDGRKLIKRCDGK